MNKKELKYEPIYNSWNLTIFFNALMKNGYEDITLKQLYKMLKDL